MIFGRIACLCCIFFQAKGYNIISTACSGGFGHVYQVESRVDSPGGIPYAIKVLLKAPIVAARLTSRTINEITQHYTVSALKCPFILPLITAFESNTAIFMIMPWAPYGDLYQYLRHHGRQPITWCQQVAFQLATALAAAHTQGIMHRDLKLSNILLLDHGQHEDHTSPVHIALADWGLAAEVHSGQEHRTLCGTTQYMSPEVSQRQPHGCAADMWSLGCIIYSMLFGRSPLLHASSSSGTPSRSGGHGAAGKPVFSPKFNACLAAVPADCAKLIKALLATDPMKRPTAAAILRKGWLSKAAPAGSQAGPAGSGDSKNWLHGTPLPGQPESELQVHPSTGGTRDEAGTGEAVVPPVAPAAPAVAQPWSASEPAWRPRAGAGSHAAQPSGAKRGARVAGRKSPRSRPARPPPSFSSMPRCETPSLLLAETSSIATSHARAPGPSKPARRPGRRAQPRRAPPSLVQPADEVAKRPVSPVQRNATRVLTRRSAQPSTGDARAAEARGAAELMRSLPGRDRIDAHATSEQVHRRFMAASAKLAAQSVALPSETAGHSAAAVVAASSAGHAGASITGSMIGTDASTLNTTLSSGHASGTPLPTLCTAGLPSSRISSSSITCTVLPSGVITAATPSPMKWLRRLARRHLGVFHSSSAAANAPLPSNVDVSQVQQAELSVPRWPPADSDTVTAMEPVIQLRLTLQSGLEWAGVCLLSALPSPCHKMYKYIARVVAASSARQAMCMLTHDVMPVVVMANLPLPDVAAMLRIHLAAAQASSLFDALRHTCTVDAAASAVVHSDRRWAAAVESAPQGIRAWAPIVHGLITGSVRRPSQRVAVGAWGVRYAMSAQRALVSHPALVAVACTALGIDLPAGQEGYEDDMVLLALGQADSTVAGEANAHGGVRMAAPWAAWAGSVKDAYAALHAAQAPVWMPVPAARMHSVAAVSVLQTQLWRALEAAKSARKIAMSSPAAQLPIQSALQASVDTSALVDTTLRGVHKECVAAMDAWRAHLGQFAEVPLSGPGVAVAHSAQPAASPIVPHGRDETPRVQAPPIPSAAPARQPSHATAGGSPAPLSSPTKPGELPVVVKIEKLSDNMLEATFRGGDVLHIPHHGRSVVWRGQLYEVSSLPSSVVPAIKAVRQALAARRRHDSST